MKEYLRLVTVNEVEMTFEIIKEAKEFLKEQKIDQWQSGYPHMEDIKNDVTNNKGYFLISNNKIISYFCLDFDGERAYDSLKGSWKSNQKYVVVHRIATKTEYRKKGMTKVIFSLIEELCRNKGINSIRIDTDEKNNIMLHTLNKNGFEYCGTIWFDNSIKIAYEKLL